MAVCLVSLCLSFSVSLGIGLIFLLSRFVDACSSPACEIVFTVCTGSWLLGVSSVLDGLRATCNKAAMRDERSGPLHWAPNVKWVDRARYVRDRSLYIYLLD